MFTEIFLFELKFRLKRVSTYVYFLIWLLVAFLYVYSDSIQLGEIGSKVAKNSAYALNSLTAVFTAFGVAIISAVVGTSIYRDYEYNTYAIIFTTPIKKFDYLWGRYLASILITIFIFSGLLVGVFLGSLMPGLEANKVTTFHLANYLQPLLLFIIPNVIFTGALFFLVASMTRSILAVYIQGVVFLSIYLISLTLLGDIKNEFVANLIDPFAIISQELATRYWTIYDKNHLLIPFKGAFAYNRLLWTGLGLVTMVANHFLFKFSSEGLSLKRNKKRVASEKEIIEAPSLKLPTVTQSFSLSTHLGQIFSLAKAQFWGIVKEIPFIAIIVIALALLFVNSDFASRSYGQTVHPVTYIMFSLLDSSLIFFIIITIIYAGELVWKERAIKFDQIYDALPMPNYVSYLSKILALTSVQVVLLVFIILFAIVSQAFKGYYNFQLPLYIEKYFGITLVSLILVSVAAIFVQTIINNKYAGHVIFIVLFFISGFITRYGFEHKLYRYASGPNYIYSDMNKFGHFVKPLLAFNIYWLAFAGLLFIVSMLISIRGTETDLVTRLKTIRYKLNPALTVSISIFALVFITSGAYIFYNTNILNRYTTTKQNNLDQADYEKNYRQYLDTPQPLITDVKVAVDIYPELRKIAGHGTYLVKNKTAKPIDTVYITDEQNSLKKLTFNREFKQTINDKRLQFYAYQLTTPIAPNESVEMAFEIEDLNPGFKNGSENNSVVYNGTFINNGYFPHIGYEENVELTDDDERKKQGLKVKEQVLAKPDDMAARMHNDLSRDADWVTFETTVSTSADQMAIAPGYLQKEWTENGRHYCEYKMDSKILNFYAFLSARYEVKRDKWNDVNIEIYYNKGHEYNLDRMIASTKKSLDYFTKNFGPYQHKQYRILEFPRYQSFAQSFPNTIPYSESIGFIAKIEKPDDIDFPFYVTAHELAHQWWGHQIVGGNVQGSSFLSETLAQYSALMVMEKEYGKENMKKFLSYEMDMYLSARGSERKKERPLAYVENQGYIHYNKGSVIMYALKDYIGEEKLNSALQKFVKDKAFQEPPYTTGLELVQYIKDVTPDDLKYLITDMFETITLFDNQAVEATYKKVGDKYNVHLKVTAKKFRSNENEEGRETEIPINDLIDIGIFADKDDKKILHFQKYKIDKPMMEFDITVDSLPLRAGIDPYNKLIDRVPTDNIRDVTEK